MKLPTDIDSSGVGEVLPQLDVLKQPENKVLSRPIERFFEYMLHKNQKDPDYIKPEGLTGYRSAKVVVQPWGDVVIKMSRNDAERGGEQLAMDLLNVKMLPVDNHIAPAFLHPSKSVELLTEPLSKNVEIRALKNVNVKTYDIVDRYALIYPKEFKAAIRHPVKADRSDSPSR